MSIFVVLNFVHSMIDGASVGGTGTFVQNLAVLSHELGRQPALYLVLWGMLTPFITNTYRRILFVPVAVTGVWILGAYTGFHLFETITHAPWLETIADSALFLFLGDILHHVKEEYQKLKKQSRCCHEH